MGQHIYNGLETIMGSTPGAPYYLSYVFNTSNQIRSAIIGTFYTNEVTTDSITIVTLDSFGCTNGVFYPRDGSWIREANRQPNEFPLRCFMTTSPNKLMAVRLDGCGLARLAKRRA